MSFASTHSQSIWSFFVVALINCSVRVVFVYKYSACIFLICILNSYWTENEEHYVSNNEHFLDNIGREKKNLRSKIEWYTKPFECFFLLEFFYHTILWFYQIHLIFTWVVRLNCLAMIGRSFAPLIEYFPLGDHYDRIPLEILDFRPLTLAMPIHF